MKHERVCYAIGRILPTSATDRLWGELWGLVALRACLPWKNAFSGAEAWSVLHPQRACARGWDGKVWEPARGRAEPDLPRGTCWSLASLFGALALPRLDLG